MNTLSSLTCLILSGGKGTRLQPIVSDRPKVLAEVNGKPFAMYLLDKLVHEGARDVVLCTGYMAAMVRDTLGDSYKGMPLRYSEEPQPRGTGGALREALHMMNSDPVFVLNGDSLVDASFSSFVSWFMETGQSAAMLLTHVEDSSRYGQVEMGKDGHIVSFKEKTTCSGPGWINAGVYLMNRSFIESIPEKTCFSLEKDFFPGLSGKGLTGYPWKSRFIDIGTEESFIKAGDFVRRSEI